MLKLYVVSVTAGKVDQENMPSSRVVGAYTNPEVANCVKQVACGDDPVVTELDVDFIDPDLLAEMHELGIDLPSKGFGGGFGGRPSIKTPNGFFTIEVRSVEGIDSNFSVDSSEAALKKAKTVRTQANRMVKILDSGYITHRWDRTNVVGENRWRKVNPGEVEILGNPAPIIVKRVVRRTPS